MNRPRASILLLLLLVLDCVTPQNIQGQGGVISVSSGNSCDSTSSNLLQCGDQGTASIMEIVAVPGGILDFQFFAILPRRVSGTSTSASCIDVQSLPDGVEVPEGNCLVGRALDTHIEVTKITMGYNMEAVDLSIPHAYSSHHTNSHKRIESQTTPGVCQGYAHFYSGTNGANDDAELFYPGSTRVESDIAGGASLTTATLRNTLALWGQGDNADALDTSLISTCRDVRYPPNGADADAYNSVGGIYDDTISTGIYFFDAPIVSATNADGDSYRSTYSCIGAKQADNHRPRSCACPDNFDDDEMEETYGPSRTVQCSECAPYYGEYLGKAPWLMEAGGDCSKGNGDQNIQNFGDDEDDDDDCGPVVADDDACEDDDETNFTNACTVSACAPFFPSEQAYLDTVLDTVCFEDNDDGSIDSICGRDDADEARVDLNIESKMAGRRFFCPNYENSHDDDNEQDGSYTYSCTNSYSKCSAPQHSYCGHTCENTFMQGLMIGKQGITKPQGRMWAGTAQVMESVYKCIDDGGDEDEAAAPYGTRRRNTGLTYQGCIEDCNSINANGGTCNVYERCISDRPPLYDDCSGDDDGYRRSVVNGPERVYRHNPVIPGCGLNFGYYPNAGDTWPTNSPPGIRKEVQDDESFCSIDDEECVSASGIGDVTPPGSSASSAPGVFVARCPACSCIPRFDDQPAEGGQKFFPALGDDFVSDDTDDEEGNPSDKTLYKSMQCPETGFADDEESIKSRCNTPYPLYEDDDDTNADGMHPDDPTDYLQWPFTVCPYGPKDRMGFTSTDHETYTGESGVRMRMADTSGTLGILQPYCQLYDLQPRPLPYYVVNVTITDNSPVDPLPTESLILTPFETAIGTGAEAVNSLGNILVRIDDVLSASGSTIGTNLGGSIVICNATTGGMPGAPPVYNMARAAPASQYQVPDGPGAPVNATIDRQEFFQGLVNPWPAIRANNNSIFFQAQSIELGEIYGTGPAAEPFKPVPNFLLPGLVPMAEILLGLPGVAGSEEEPRRSWWYYINALERQRYGRNCGQIGIDAKFFGNDANAAAACAGNRHRCVPGFVEGMDWTLQQRNFDSDITSDNAKLRTQKRQVTSGNNGLWERYIRDVLLTEHTPCVVSGMFMDLLTRATNCKEFLELSSTYGHLPPNWAELLDDNGPCGDVNYWIQDGKLLYEDPLVRDDSGIAIQLELVAADAVLTADSLPVSSGKIQTSPPPVCVAATQSSNGHIGVFVKNTGTFEASYLLSANCSANVVVSQQATNTLAPGETKEFDLVLSQSGPADLGTFSCSLVLGTPAVADFILDTVELTDCQLVSTADNPITVPGNGSTDACSESGADCLINSSTSNSISSQTKNYLADILVITLVLIAILTYALFLWLNRQATTQYSKRKAAESILEQSQSTLSQQRSQKELLDAARAPKQ